jgi:hypothetical protein
MDFSICFHLPITRILPTAETLTDLLFTRQRTHHYNNTDIFAIVLLQDVLNIISWKQASFKIINCHVECYKQSSEHVVVICVCCIIITVRLKIFRFKVIPTQFNNISQEVKPAVSLSPVLIVSFFIASFPDVTLLYYFIQFSSCLFTCKLNSS